MRFLSSLFAVLVAVIVLLVSPLATKTYYPSFKRLVHALNVFLGLYQAKMSARLGLGGTTYATDLANLVAALNQIETNWPIYDELP